jgi:hypothetical protein
MLKRRQSFSSMRPLCQLCAHREHKRLVKQNSDSESPHQKNAKHKLSISRASQASGFRLQASGRLQLILQTCERARKQQKIFSENSTCFSTQRPRATETTVRGSSWVQKKHCGRNLAIGTCTTWQDSPADKEYFSESCTWSCFSITIIELINFYYFKCFKNTFRV